MREDDRQARVKERERATLARQIFDNPLWDEAYTSLVNRQLERMLAKAADGEETLECKRSVLALRDLKGYLETIMQTGKLAQAQLEKDQEDGRKRNATA